MENSDNIPDYLIDFFSQEGSCEKEKLKEWINRKNENKKLFREMQDIWQAAAIADPSSSYDENSAWEKLRSELKVSHKHRHLTWIKYAAVAVIFSLIGSLTFYLLTPVKEAIPESFQEVYVPYGSTSKILLPDGTYVWLNAGSFLKYNNLYNVKNRTVLLKGEAFFDVRKNSGLPFIVQTPGMEVKAIGTKFNIKSYPEEKTISATVVEGKIQVFNQLENSKNRNELYLSTRQTAVFRKEFTASPVIEPRQHNNEPAVQLEEIPAKIVNVETDINTDLFTSWHEGKLIIERETLGSLAVKLERRYNVRIVFQEPSLKNYVFSGILKDETFEQVLEVIRLTSPLHFSVDGNVVRLSEDKSRKNRLN